MGLFDFLKSQLIQVIEWTDSSSDTMVYRFPVQGNEIKMGAKLVVREGQAAVFIDQGQMADVFGPGLHTLETENMPILTKIRSWPYGFESPFKCEVYFVNTRQFTDQKWGTPNPVMLRDPEFGPIRLRAFGIYSMRVADPAVFMKEIVGTDGLYTTDQINGQLKRLIVSAFSDVLGEARIPALDLASRYDELSELAQQKCNERFAAHGLSLVQFYVENISLPKEVEKALDERSRMGLIGNLNDYSQLKAAEAIGDAARNQGGMAGAGMSMGAGAAMGAMMTNAFSGQFNAMQQPQQPAAQQPQQPAAAPQAGTVTPAGAKFCSECGAELNPGAKFCSQCGTPVASA